MTISITKNFQPPNRIISKNYKIEDEITQEREKRTALCTKYRRSIRIISVIDNALIVSDGSQQLRTRSSNYSNCCSCHSDSYRYCRRCWVIDYYWRTSY